MVCTFYECLIFIFKNKDTFLVNNIQHEYNTQDIQYQDNLTKT